MENTSKAEIRKLLDRLELRASRAMGQNFLHDAVVASAIVDSLGAEADDVVVEVGPGTGALSEHLVGKVRKLLLIEYDLRLAGYLRERFAGEAGVEVIQADAARFDIRRLYCEGPVHFIGNLPYSAGGAIMRNFLSRPGPVGRAVLMLQKEVVDRMAAVPGCGDYGVLSLRVQSQWRMERLMIVPPRAFFPQPQIDSSVLSLSPLPESVYPVYDQRLFDELIRRGFSQRRKQVWKQLPCGMEEWQRIAERIGVSEKARAEELSVAQWIEVTRALDDHPQSQAQSGDEMFSLVDMEDRVVGSASRREAHEQGLIHRAVHLFVVNKSGEVFLQKRSRLKDKDPGLWDSSAAGHCDIGEDYVATARRELYEELGVSSAQIHEVAALPPHAGNGWEHIRVFRVDYSGAIRYPAAEVETGIWMPHEKVDNWLSKRPCDFAGAFVECWQVFREG